MTEPKPRKKVNYPIPEGTPQSRCRSANCKAIIYWITGSKGGMMPVDPDGTPHWATCPDAKTYGKKK